MSTVKLLEYEKEYICCRCKQVFAVQADFEQHYYLNSDYYTTVLCENRDQPELHCDGKCYFSRQLNLTTNSQKHAEPPAFLPILSLFANSIYDWTSQKPPTTNYCTSSCYNDPGTMSPHLADIDHPPQVQV